MSSQSIADRLKGGGCLLLDGGTGSELQRRGVDVLRGAAPNGQLEAWSALANVEAADVVQQVHQDYLRVGADILISNNFWTSPTRMSPIGLGDRWQDYARAAVRNAIRARDGMNPEAYVAGGMAPPCQQRRSEGRNDPDVVVLGETAFQKEIADHARLLADEGVDLLWLEYMGRIADCVAGAEACGDMGLPVALGVRHIREDGTMQYGERLEDLAEALSGRRVDAVLLMCSKPECISEGLPRLKAAFGGPVGAYPNIGYQPTAPLRRKAEDGPGEEADFFQGTGQYSPARLATFAKAWKEMGAQIIGGCCATGPEHIAAMRPVVKG